MNATWVIRTSTCKACGVCAAVCPSQIPYEVEQGKMAFCSDRLSQCIGCGQCMAVCPTRSIQVAGLTFERDFFDLPAQTPQSKKAFFDLICSRRAIRNFQDKPVPRELLEKVVEAIAFAPPSFPPHKTELVVVQNTDLIRKALPHMVQMYDFLVKGMRNPLFRWIIKQRLGLEKYSALVHHVIPLMEKRLPGLKSGVEDTITRHAPAMILFHANCQAENSTVDIYIALTYGVLAAHALGLGGTPIDLIPQPVERNKTLRSMFGIPEKNQVVGAMILGYPKYSYQRAIRRDLKSVSWF